MARKFPPGTLCVYCGTAQASTVDHALPRALFAKDNRHHLIRVPSCGGCNNQASKDEEYALQQLTMGRGVDDSPDVRDVRARLSRAMRRPDHRKMRNATRRNFRQREMWKGGIYLGPQPVQLFDRSRLSRFVARIVCALFYHEMKSILPLDYVSQADMLADNHWDYELKKQKTLLDLHRYAISQGTRAIGTDPSAFEYAFITDDFFETDGGDPNMTAWVLRFYGAANFFGFTMPRRLVQVQAEPFTYWRGSPPPQVRVVLPG